MNESQNRCNRLVDRIAAMKVEYEASMAAALRELNEIGPFYYLECHVHRHSRFSCIDRSFTMLMGVFCSEAAARLKERFAGEKNTPEYATHLVVSEDPRPLNGTKYVPHDNARFEATCIKYAFCLGYGIPNNLMKYWPKRD